MEQETSGTASKRFFEWLETKAYKMHVRVLLSRYRAYTPCETCHGARLKTEALLWRLGTRELADAVLEPARRFRPDGAQWPRETLEALPGLTIHDVMLLPIERAQRSWRSSCRSRSMRRPICCSARSARRFSYLCESASAI